MARKTAKDFDQGLLDLFDGYVHGRMERREFLSKAARYATGGLTAAALLDMLSPDYALAAQIAADDPDIRTHNAPYPSPEGHGEIDGYFARPSGGPAQVPGVVVVHENRGRNPYIEDVARRLAKSGFLALAPDGLSALGGYPGNDSEGRTMQQSLDREKLRNDFFAAFDHLKGHESCTGKVGVVGFCYGGGICNAMAVNFPDLAACVPFYGASPATQDVGKIVAPLMLHFAGLDDRVNAMWPDYEQALKAAGKTYTAHVYPDVNHGFHNDTTPRYDKDAAELAWSRTIAFFQANLA